LRADVGQTQLREIARGAVPGSSGPVHMSEIPPEGVIHVTVGDLRYARGLKAAGIVSGLPWRLRRLRRESRRSFLARQV
jgi:hypothetical protein